jgi:hypothetical protein
MNKYEVEVTAKVQMYAADEEQALQLVAQRIKLSSSATDVVVANPVLVEENE